MLTFEYYLDTIAVALKTTNLLAQSLSVVGITGCGLRIFDAYNETEEPDTAHFRLDATCGAFSQTAETVRLQVPYDSKPSGLVTLEIDLPQGTPLDTFQRLGIQVLTFYEDQMNVHYGEDMPTTWGDIKVE